MTEKSRYSFVIYLSAAVSAAILLLCGCYPSEEFADIPPNLEEKQRIFEDVAKDLQKIETANEETAVTFTSSKDKRLRRASALRLMTLGHLSPNTVKALVNLVQNDTEHRVRSAAVRALGEVPGNVTGVSAIVRAMCDDHPNVRLYATKSLLHLDSKANTAILDFLTANGETQKHCPAKSDPNHTLQKELLQQLGVQGARFLSLYVQGLSHPQTDVVRLSLTQIRKTGRSASSALPAMLDLLQSPDDRIRFDTIQTFTTVGDQHPLVIPALFDISESDPAPRVRTAAANAIKQIQTQHMKANKANGTPEKKHPRRSSRKPGRK